MVAGDWEHYAWREKKKQGERKVKDRVFQSRDDERARSELKEVNDLLILDMEVVIYFSSM